MRRRTWIFGLASVVAILAVTPASEAGLFRRKWRPRARPVATVAPAVIPSAAPRAIAPGRFLYPNDPPTPTNGWGYGLPAAGYGSAYPAHPLGPG